MTEQDPATGAVDPRPEEMNTGSQSGMAPVAISDDAKGMPLEQIGGSATTQAPEPAATTEAGEKAALDAHSVGEIVQTYASEAEKDVKNAIVDISTGIKSVVNTAAMVEKAETQSTDMQTGAQVAHDNAVMTFAKRFETLCKKLGPEIADKIKADLAKLHGAEQVIENALKTAGVIAK